MTDIITSDHIASVSLADADKDPQAFAKYLAPGGRYSQSSEDGLTITSFSLRKAKP